MGQADDIKTKPQHDSNMRDFLNEAGPGANWASKYAGSLSFDHAWENEHVRQNVGTHSGSESVLAKHRNSSQVLERHKELSLLPEFELEKVGALSFGPNDEQDGKRQIGALNAEKESEAWLKLEHEDDDSRTSTHLSFGLKHELDEIMTVEPFKITRPAESKEERESWWVGALTMQHEQKLFENNDLQLWIGAGVTVRQLTDQELIDKIGEHPVTVFTHFKVRIP
jgi:hypothetical protein